MKGSCQERRAATGRGERRRAEGGAEGGERGGGETGGIGCGRRESAGAVEFDCADQTQGNRRLVGAVETSHCSGTVVHANAHHTRQRPPQ